MENLTDKKNINWPSILSISILATYVTVWFLLFSSYQSRTAWDFSAVLLLFIDPIAGGLLSVIPSRPYVQFGTGLIVLILSIAFPEKIIWRLGSLMPVFNIFIPLLVAAPFLIGTIRILKLKKLI